MRTIFAAAGTILIIFTLTVFGVSQYLKIQFDRHCGSYLKMAGDANSVLIASQRLDKAINYLEVNNITNGTTAALWTNPLYDVGQWFNNLKEAQSNLHDFSTNASETEISTTLMKLRETVLDHHQSGDSVTLPPGIEYYPYNVFWFWFGRFSIFMGIVGIIFVVGAITFD
jgi:hypothetical protein